MTRREMLALSAAGLAGLRFAPAAPFNRVGVQLYTTRRQFGQDPAGTLAAIAKIGYKEVESAGYASLSPADFRKALDANGLTCPSAHVAINEVDTGLAKQLENAATIGHKWLVVPSLPGSMRTADGYKRVGEILSKAAEEAKKQKVRIGYHNHDVDFREVDGRTGMDHILTGSSKDVAAELDVYWIVKAGHDPFAFIEKYKGRVKMLHLKDATAAPEQAMRAVGEGTIDWPKFLPKAKSAGVEHVFVEHDNPTDAMVSITSSYNYVSKLK